MMIVFVSELFEIVWMGVIGIDDLVVFVWMIYKLVVGGNCFVFVCSC